MAKGRKQGQAAGKVINRVPTIIGWLLGAFVPGMVAALELFDARDDVALHDLDVVDVDENLEIRRANFIAAFHRPLERVGLIAGMAFHVFVDTRKSREVYQKWLAMTRPADRFSPDGTRRPYWMLRPLKPAREFYKLPDDKKELVSVE